MTLPISSNIIRNTIGYIELEVSMINNNLRVVENPNSTPQQATDAENIIKQCTKNIGKLVRTIEERTSWTMPATGYTNAQLKGKGII